MDGTSPFGRTDLLPVDRRVRSRAEPIGRCSKPPRDLQDVGYLIDYEQHHKHSYHLILNSRLAGFRPQELDLIANIARYHRGGKPKAKHANYDRLPAADQERVRRLAAMLRIAGGLDRSHSQQVRGVELEFSPRAITMYVLADEMPEVDLSVRATAL